MDGRSNHFESNWPADHWFYTSKDESFVMALGTPVYPVQEVHTGISAGLEWREFVHARRMICRAQVWGNTGGAETGQDGSGRS